MSYLYASSSSAGAISLGLNKTEEIVNDASQITDTRQSTATNETTNDENDYIRTAIVTNASDKFMNFVSLCLICGSVGKDIEGTMITCASCAQSYHTFCVGMHDKVWILIFFINYFLLKILILLIMLGEINFQLKNLS